MAFRVAIVQCRGSPYEVGLQQAKVFAATARGRAFLRRKTVRFPWWLNARVEERMYAKFAPSIWEEINGLADGLGISIERAALAFGNAGRRPPLGGCSAAISSEVYGRNYDFRARFYGARIAIMQVTGSYASLGSSEILTGRLDGVNECGLAIGLHLVSRTPAFLGLCSVLLVRMVLDQCASTEEAIELLRRCPPATRYNYSLLDANGQAAVVESAPGAVAVRRGPWLACTNHFQSPAMQRLNRARESSSWRRLPPLEAWASRGLAAEAMFQALNASTSPAFHHGYMRGAGTLHTLVCQPKTRRVLLGVGGDAAELDIEMIDFDFPAWLAGRDLAIGALEGQLGGMAKPFAWPVRPRSKGAAVS
jgi:predicted choloylglycine hydrolase